MTDAIRVGLAFEPGGSLPRPSGRRLVLRQTLSRLLACDGGASPLARSPRFTRPAAGGRLLSGRHNVHGVAWTVDGLARPPRRRRRLQRPGPARDLAPG